jgi:hypothetical protein
VVGLGAFPQPRLLRLDEIAYLRSFTDFRAGAQAGIGADLAAGRDGRSLQMAEGADARTRRDPDAGAEDDVRLHDRVAADLGIVGEEDGLRRDEADAFRHRLGAAAALPERLDLGELGAAVDAGDFVRIDLDNRRAVPVGRREHDDIRKIIFAGGIVVADAGEERPEVLDAHCHEA